MKKGLAILLALAFAAFLLPGCPGGGGGGGGGEEWGVAVARAVDQQFGPVDTSATGAGVAGNHEANLLKGVANNAVLVAAVRMIEQEELTDTDWDYDWNLPGKGLGGKLQAMASAVVGSVDNNPCENDQDQDGTPDVAEDRCDATTDPGCTGLCMTAATQVSCSSVGNSFTVKFTDCVTATDDGFTLSTGVSSSPNTTTVHCASAAASPTATTNWNIMTSTTTSGKLVPANTSIGSISTACGDTSFHPKWLDFTSAITYNCPTSGTFTVAFSAGTIYWLTSTWTTDSALYNGSVTLNYGVAGPDEQLYRTNYNNLTKVWDIDGTGSPDTNPYVSVSGASLEYRVIEPDGDPANGTGCQGHSPCNPDGMVINNLQIKRDMDGNDGSVFKTGNYAMAGGWDFEDGDFLFSGPGAVVMLKDKQGNNGAHLVGEDADGDPIFAISLYDRDVLPDQMCQDPNNKACWVRVSIDIQSRTFDVLEVVNCPNLDLAAGDLGVSF